MSDPSTARTEDPHGDGMKARHHREIMAAFSAKALRGTPLPELLNEACRQVVDGLGVGHAKVLEYDSARDDMLVVAGVGWAEGVVGTARLPATMDSPPGRAFRANEPVFIDNILEAREFRYSALLRDHGVIALVNVPIRTGEYTFGVLEADSDEPRQFTEDDRNFLIGFADLTAVACMKCRTDAERDRLIHELTAARQLAEATLESNKRLLAATGHDLTQPVQSILLTLDQLDRRTTDVETRRLVTRSRNAALRLRRDLDQILTVAQIERGALDLHIGTVAIGPLLAELVEEFQPQATAKELALRHVPTRLQARTDGHLLDHILRNLISNAVKYTSRGRILVGCHRRGEMMSIEVHDTGTGIAARDLDRIFKEFDRLDPTRGEGRGLGLAVVKQMADLLGHPITVKSRRGGGTCFSLSLPRG